MTIHLRQGRRIGGRLENSTFTVLDYDAADQVTNIWHKKASGGTTLSRHQYGYDDAGRRTWVKRADGKGDVFRYDPTDQLTNVLYAASNPDSSPSGWTESVTYHFDAAGNRSSVVSSVGGTTSYTVNSLNQYTVINVSTCSSSETANTPPIIGFPGPVR